MVAEANRNFLNSVPERCIVPGCKIRLRFVRAVRRGENFKMCIASFGQRVYGNKSESAMPVELSSRRHEIFQLINEFGKLNRRQYDS
jgi:hypothetical protein